MAAENKKEIYQLWTVPVVAERWRKHPDFVRKVLACGLLRELNFGGTQGTRIRPEEVEDFEVWAQGKDLTDLGHIKDIRTGEEVPHRFADAADILTIPKQA